MTASYSSRQSAVNKLVIHISFHSVKTNLVFNMSARRMSVLVVIIYLYDVIILTFAFIFHFTLFLLYLILFSVYFYLT